MISYKTLPDYTPVYRPFEAVTAPRARSVEARTQELRSALYQMGDALQGGAFRFCSADHFVLPQGRFNPAHTDEETVMRHGKTKTGALYKERYLFDTAARSFDKLVDLVGKRVKARDRYSPFDHPDAVYDNQKMRAGFASLWHDDLLIDPRLGYAEELFARCGDNPFGFAFARPALCAATLDWMAGEQTARRLGQSFLYSRFAPHLRGDSQALLGVMDMASRYLFKGQTIRLKQYGSVLAITPVGENRNKSHCAIEWGGGQMHNIEDLNKAMPHICEDYRQLATGAWARRMLAKAPAGESPAPNVRGPHCYLECRP